MNGQIALASLISVVLGIVFWIGFMIGGRSKERQLALQATAPTPLPITPSDSPLEDWINQAGQLARSWLTAYDTWLRDGTYTAKDAATGRRLGAAAETARHAFREHLRNPPQVSAPETPDRRDVRLIMALEEELGCSPQRDVARRILAAIDAKKEA